MIEMSQESYFHGATTIPFPKNEVSHLLRVQQVICLAAHSIQIEQKGTKATKVNMAAVKRDRSYFDLHAELNWR